MFGRLWGLLIFCGGWWVAPVSADDVTARVVILANSDERESVKLAEYYAEKRGVPKENIVALPMPIEEGITWRTFVDTMFNPLQAELVARGWIDAIGMDLTDEAGRKKYVMNGHTISYLVVCRGVPLKVVHDPLLWPGEIAPALKPEFRTNAAAVDSELALLALSATPLIAFAPNPLFKSDAPSDLHLRQFVKVGRLDGPSFSDARALIDRALAAERTGLIGRGYIDIGGPHKSGDVWLEDASKQLAALDFDTDVERVPGSMPAWTRMDAPALYFGWYAGGVNGPFTQDGFVFPDGAVALHIHSFSAATVRSATSGWVGPLVARGVTATFGNVTEPYLELTHQPQLILKSLARGDRLGDAAAYAMPVYSWQAMMIGDPLYRPFGVKPAEQWAKRDKLNTEQRAYVVLRRMRELERGGDRNAAIWTGLGAEKAGRHLAVALGTAKLQMAAEDPSGARQTLDWVAGKRSFTAVETPVAVEAARVLQNAGDAKTAVAVWRSVLGGRGLAKETRVAWLPPAIEAAKAAADARQALYWENDYKELTAPPPAAVEAGAGK
jgi:uncharacterized protein (TIGR03790 family)